MNCPHCSSDHTDQLNQMTHLGYQKYRCQSCGKQYNERTGTKFNFITYPTEIVMLVVQYYYLFKVSLEDVVKLMLMRGFSLSHQTVHNWVHTFETELALTIRDRRRGNCGHLWHVNATYLKIEGRWCYLYRAIDSEGHLVDVYLSDVRDQAAAERFFLQAENTTGITPDQITTDKELAFAAAHEEVFGNSSHHRNSKYKKIRIEQNHHSIKSRWRVMKNFKNIFCALRFCTVYEELIEFFKSDTKKAIDKRRFFVPRFQEISYLTCEVK